MKVADEDKYHQPGRSQSSRSLQTPLLFSFRVKDTHDTKDVMAGLSVDLKIIKASDIVKKGRVRWSADGGQMDLHLDAADILQLAGIDEPFGTFAIAF